MADGREATRSLRKHIKMQGPKAAIDGLRRMVHHALEVNVIHCNVVISACAAATDWSSAWGLLSRMRTAWVEATIASYGGVAASLKRGWPRALALHEALSPSGLRPSTILMTSIAAGLQQGLQWQRSLALGVLDRALPPSVICQNAVASACAKSFIWSAALHILMGQKEKLMQPDASSVGSATDAFTNARMWRSALRILHGMMDLQIRCHQIAYNSAASACVAMREWKEVLGVLRDMALNFATLSTRSFNAAICALPSTARWQHAALLIQALSRDGLKPSTVSLNSHIDACGADWALSVAILDIAQAATIVPDRLSCNSVLSACSNYEAWQTSLSIVGQSRQHKSADVVGLNSAMRACRRHWEEALNLCSGLLPRAVRPSSITLNTVLSSCEQCVRWLQALWVLGSWRRLRTRQDVISYNSSISACESSWTMGLQCLSAVLQQQLLPDLVTYNAASHSSSAVSWKSSLTIFSDLSHTCNLSYDTVGCGTALAACSLGFSWTGALQVLLDMNRHMLHANAWTISSAVSSCEKSLRPATALKAPLPHLVSFQKDPEPRF
ncbi:PPR10 [Symbiodinium natans]|uniref:PPR10 protein n=1 Tax=Symbiodinium natans TaxID=878477 RepID=A0A812T7J9_9DINO|nr:PPR10 [Symbiodinium natans]